MTTLTALPESFPAGTTVRLARSYGDFPASAGWALKLYLAGAAVMNAAGVADGDGFVITLTAAATAALTPGLYRWVERATKGSESYDAASGLVTVTRNLATAAAGDAQSWEEKQLAEVEAAIATMIAGKLQRYQIASRVGEYFTLDEMRKLRGELIAAVNRQRNGGQIGRQHHLRFGQAGSP